MIRFVISAGLMSAWNNPQFFLSSFEWTREAMFSWTIHVVFSHLLNL
jgi:hypothetical protein